MRGIRAKALERVLPTELSEPKGLVLLKGEASTAPSLGTEVPSIKTLKIATPDIKPSGGLFSGGLIASLQNRYPKTPTSVENMEVAQKMLAERSTLLELLAQADSVAKAAQVVYDAITEGLEYYPSHSSKAEREKILRLAGDQNSPAERLEIIKEIDPVDRLTSRLIALLSPDEPGSSDIKNAFGRMTRSRDKLVLSNFRFMLRFVIKSNHPNISRDNSLGVAISRVLEEVTAGYYPSIGSFPTYLEFPRWYERPNDTFLSAPYNLTRSAISTKKRISEFEGLFYERHGRHPTTEEIAKELGIRRTKIFGIRSLSGAFSLDQPYSNGDNERNFHEVIADPQKETLVEIPNLDRVLRTLERNMPVKSYKIFEEYFGSESTYESVGGKYGVSKERVRQIVAFATTKLRILLGVIDRNDPENFLERAKDLLLPREYEYGIELFVNHTTPAELAKKRGTKVESVVGVYENLMGMLADGDNPFNIDNERLEFLARRHLSEKHAKLIIDIYVTRRDRKELAREMNIPVKTLNSRLQNIINKLKKILSSKVE